MGLFDDLKLAKDLVSDLAASVKASNRLEKLGDQVMEDYEDVLTDQDKAFYKEYKKLCDKRDATENLDEQNSYIEPIEQALCALLLSVSTNTSLPKKFRTEAKEAVAEYRRLNDAPEEHFLEYIERVGNKMVKTDQDRKDMDEFMAEMKKELDSDK